MKLNRKEYLNRVHACWLGKNIGGTIGTPYENTKEFLDVKGFNSPKGEPLANDDLDLQLIWLQAVEDRGIRNVTPSVLAEYWINYIPPHWNEYGIGKANLKLGILPPYSGEYNNEKWKHSNGAWIRTEIWACLFPGFPSLAVRYAYRDACVDHGLGEGTYAAMFVAALESQAFVEGDLKKLIDTALSFIPENSRVSKSVKFAEELFEKGASLREARDEIIKQNEDLGWFQAPSNVAFTMLGLLYGKCDFKASILNAVNCADDTDCTGATAGAILGIMGGREKIDDDWAEYIGDSISSFAVDLSNLFLAKSCTELSRRVYELTPSALKAYGIYMEYTEGENERENLDIPLYISDFDIPESGLSVDFPDLIYAKGRVEFDKCKVAPGDTVELKFIFKNCMPDPKQLSLSLSLPEGWSASAENINIYLQETRLAPLESISGITTEVVYITVGENVETKNTVEAFVSCPGRPTTSYLPIILWA